MLDKGVADAVTFPWGSVVLFGVDKVTKYHMDAPLYVTTFAYTMNKGTYERMSAAQKKVIDDHCTTEWAGKIGGPWADFEHAGIAKIKAEPGHEVYSITDEQLGEWKKSAEPLQAEVGRRREEGRRQSRRGHEGAAGQAEAIQRGLLSQRRAPDEHIDGGASRRRRFGDAVTDAPTPPLAAPDAAGRTRRRGSMNRFIDTIEMIAAIFVGIVAADIFISVLLRYFFSVQIPDSYDFGRLLLGILIFWGIAATSFRGTHITVDLVYANVGPRAQRVIDVFATLVLLFVVTFQTYTLFDKVVDHREPTTC